MKAFTINNLFPLICISFFFCSKVSAQQKTVAERLGYPADAKLLIIHADDLGVAHSENMASIKALEEGTVNSASIMVPCPWFPEIAAYARGHSTADLGLHLTLTSEWKYYKWGPVTSKDSVTSLVNNEGYFYDLVPKVAEHADPKHVEIELRNQVKKALLTGIDVTHLDTHMGTVFATPEFVEA
ncbi:MAG: polysaccharide deacetylase family protein, partial [Aurantibacter sp.]